MKKIELILDTVRVVNVFIMIISLFSDDYETFLVTCALCWMLLFIRFISFLVRKIRRKKSGIKNNLKVPKIEIATEVQMKNAIMLVERLERLEHIIDSNGSFYDAQREYVKIKRIITELNEEELQDSQRKLMLGILEGMSAYIIKLELKR